MAHHLHNVSPGEPRAANSARSRDGCPYGGASCARNDHQTQRATDSPGCKRINRLRAVGRHSGPRNSEAAWKERRIGASAARVSTPRPAATVSVPRSPSSSARSLRLRRVSRLPRRPWTIGSPHDPWQRSMRKSPRPTTSVSARTASTATPVGFRDPRVACGTVRSTANRTREPHHLRRARPVGSFALRRNTEKTP